MRVAPFASLDPASYREIVRRALAEDVRWGDVTTEAVVPAELTATGVIVVSTSCVLAGLDVAMECFRQLDPHVELEAARREGERCESGTELARLRGGAAALLTAERTALNFLQRLCGIATVTRDFVDASSGRITVLDTRETMPTLRALEKYAVRVAGGVNHRVGLDDGVLVGVNHVRMAGSVAEAVRRMRAVDAELPIEVEVQSLDDVDAALEAGVTTVKVDGLPIDAVREAVRRSRGRAKVEVSGPVPLDRMAELAQTGAEYVSIAQLTQAVTPIEMTFELASDVAPQTGAQRR
ncbi:MAG: carboxylating nicotinate-nucleotide diphosphorylase [Vicinamibacterales bacterium]|nr:carboxylating nicotinate-nucleotide diphosphorylase [Vicinamibacterales bacterium]